MTHKNNPLSGNGIIGLFNDSFPPIIDGVTLTVQNYAHWLRRMDVPVSVVTPWNPTREATDYDVMRYFSLPILWRHPYRYGYPKLDPFIWRRLRQTPFRLIHAHCPFSSGRLAVYVKKKQGVPLVGTFHSKYRSDLKHGFRHTPWMVDIIMKKILDFFEACDEVWIPQAKVEETVREYGFKGPVSVMENGNDLVDQYDAVEVLNFKKEAARRLKMNPSRYNLLFVGQHIWEKGLRTVMDALALLNRRGVDFHMNFIGVGYALEDMKRIAAKEGFDQKVTFHGQMTDRKLLSEYYAASDLFVFPSFYDNAPLVVREAAAMNTASVLVKGSTAAEVIKEGENGFLVEPDSVSLANLIQRLFESKERISIASAGARRTLVRSWQDVVEEVADRYASLLNRHVRR